VEGVAEELSEAAKLVPAAAEKSLTWLLRVLYNSGESKVTLISLFGNLQVFAPIRCRLGPRAV
jgi:hypothetical protein